jgi:hypothetical protein
MAGRTPPPKAPASALLRARWARELSPKPLADAPWENFASGPCTPRPLAGHIFKCQKAKKMGGTSYRMRGANLATAGLSAYSSDNHKTPLSRYPRPRRKHLREARMPHSSLLTARSRSAENCRDHRLIRVRFQGSRVDPTAELLEHRRKRISPPVRKGQNTQIDAILPSQGDQQPARKDTPPPLHTPVDTSINN